MEIIKPKPYVRFAVKEVSINYSNNSCNLGPSVVHDFYPDENKYIFFSTGTDLDIFEIKNGIINRYRVAESIAGIDYCWKELTGDELKWEPNQNVKAFIANQIIKNLNNNINIYKTYKGDLYAVKYIIDNIIDYLNEDDKSNFLHSKIDEALDKSLRYTYIYDIISQNEVEQIIKYWIESCIAKSKKFGINEIDYISTTSPIIFND